MATMRAARFHGNKDVRVEDVPVPKIGEKERYQVLVEVEWCGICGSDLHEFDAGPLTVTIDPVFHPLTGEAAPAIMGHEMCGRVKSAGPDSKFKPGQAVMVDPRLVCRSCSACSSGCDQQCQKLGFMGYSGQGGGFAEFVPVEERMLHAIPDNVDMSIAALIEPLAVAYHAVKVSGVEQWKGKTALVIGGGPVGYAVILTLKAFGVEKVIVSEPSLTRREQTGKIAEAVIDPRTENVADKCRELTGGEGVHVAFDCAGIQVGLDAAYDALRHNGIYLNVSLWEKPMVIPFRVSLLKEIWARSSCCYNDEDFREVMKMMAEGKYQGCEKMITSRISIEDVVTKGFNELFQNRDSHIKILVTPKAGNLR